MAELGEFLSGLLSEPESAEKLSRIASVLGGEADTNEKEDSGLAGGLSGILSSLSGGKSEGGRKEDGGLDMAGLMFKALPLIGQFSEGENDPKVQLLYALRPYLTGERRKRLEDAVTFIKISRLAGPVLEIFNDGKDG